jgi:hypothetical protein
MIDHHIAAPRLWIMPADILGRLSSEQCAKIISSQFGGDVWLFEGGSLAFCLPDILVTAGGVAEDYASFLEHTRPFFNYLNSALGWSATGFDPSALDLDIPDEKYWSQVLLQPEETNRRSCVYIKSRLSDWQPFSFRACSSYELDSAGLRQLRRYLEKWCSRGSHREVHGEKLSIGNIELTEITSGPTETSYPKYGYEVSCSSYTPCTWPWIDLYLEMRRGLPVRQRFSIEFFNP